MESPMLPKQLNAQALMQCACLIAIGSYRVTQSNNVNENKARVPPERATEGAPGGADSDSFLSS
jgi:hypothetical protein